MPWPNRLAVTAAFSWAILSTNASAASAQPSHEVSKSYVHPFDSVLNACPAPCSGETPANWTTYPSFERLAVCKQPMLFDLAIHTPVNDHSKTTFIRACTSTQYGSNGKRNAIGSEMTDDASCRGAIVESQVPLQFVSGPSTSNGTMAFTLEALQNMKNYVRQLSSSGCSKNIMLAYYKGAIIGAYGGEAMGQDTLPSMSDAVMEHIRQSDPRASMASQICGDDRDMTHVAGLVITPSEDISFVQDALVSWSEGKCFKATSSKNVKPPSSKHLLIRESWQQPSAVKIGNMTFTNSTSQRQVKGTNGTYNSLASQGGKYCDTKTVVPGDSCTSLANACRVSLSDFYKLNNAGDGNDYCRKLQIGQKVCCTTGSLKPLPQDDGTCYTHTVQAGDTCSDIGLPWMLTPKDLADFNDKTTWGWRGCGNLVVGLKICLSKGYPPAPTPLSNAICGPQKPGTIFNGPIKDASVLAALNPCPLNSCCNVWGQCGIDSQFCTNATGPTGNPGTSPPGIFGCISNCGTDIINNKQAPPNGYQRVGYYETFNWDRACLHMRADWSNTLGYTHMHWAFGDVSRDFAIYVNDTHHQWDAFMSLKDVKKIISFGGWGFSTDPSTFQVLRQAMFPENRDRFVGNIVAFAERTGIDGIDFDWEYPGAPDIPGIPMGLNTDGPYYLATLQALRKALPAKYSLSMAAPASYWYLKPFPIKEMSEVVDYIVYMTYDLHGQWDYGSSWAQSGCPTGNCLRSHVNQTEVMLALSMITKAGVSSTKIMVGESSYGRSFHMAQAGCSGPQCLFTGTNSSSNAAKGRCTNTGGYLADAEIKEIISKSSGSIKLWYDQDTASDYLVYNDVEWVAYMAADTKKNRREKWRNLNFLGTIDWAVDLQEFNVADMVGPTGDYNKSSCINVFDDIIWDWVNPSIEAPVGCTNIIQPSPLPVTVTLTAYTTITMVSGDSFSTTVVSAPFAISEVSYQPFTIDPTDVGTRSVITYNPVPRVTPDPISISVPAGWTVTSPEGEQSGQLPPTTSIVGLPGATTTTTSNPGGGFLLPITWQPTVSYRIPSMITPKYPAPSQIPDDDQHPVNKPNPGVKDCDNDTCTKGEDCRGGDCWRGGDCIGPHCTTPGDCIGPHCIRGGNCIGYNCERGGRCEGDNCDVGGGCQGHNCTTGGDCSGPHCRKGGGCVKVKIGDCNPGGCKGNNCFADPDCFGAQCDRITISPKPRPKTTPAPIAKPTCLINCPKLPECPGGDIFCNLPCNIFNCPPGRMPTAKACTTYQTADSCTEIVSSTRVQIQPTTSWSTTTRTRCKTVVDCDAVDRTVTTTISTSQKSHRVIKPTSIVDEQYDDHPDAAFFASASSDYESWISMIEATHPVETSQPTPEPTPQLEAECEFWDEIMAYKFHVFNIKGWAADHGRSLRHEEEGCGALTEWVWHDTKDDKPANAWFNLPFVMKAGCVERAIVSAGGPKIKCKGGGVKIPNPDEFVGNSTMDGVDMAPPPPTPTPHPTYVPMDWGSAGMR